MKRFEYTDYYACTRKLAWLYSHGYDALVTVSDGKFIIEATKEVTK